MEINSLSFLPDAELLDVTKILNRNSRKYIESKKIVKEPEIVRTENNEINDKSVIQKKINQCKNNDICKKKSQYIDLFSIESLDVDKSKVTIEFQKLVDIFTEEYQAAIQLFFDYKQDKDEKNPIVEFVLDVGREPYLFYIHDKDFKLKKYYFLREYIKYQQNLENRFNQNNEKIMFGESNLVSYDLLDNIIKNVSEFSDIDNRAGITGTLHRVSRKLNKGKRLIGLTIRVGRSISDLYKLLLNELNQQQNILFLGEPGSGKTSILRSCAMYLADHRDIRVELIDTSSEIGGAGDVIYKDLINCRRTFVLDRNIQHKMILEAICNHSPEYLLVDEIGNHNEVHALLDVTQRGINILTTAHGKNIFSLYQNPVLNKLLGDFQHVILSSSEVREKNKNNKTTHEKKGKSCFHTIVEVKKPGIIVVINDIDKAIDSLLSKHEYPIELRYIKNNEVITNTLFVRLDESI